jgi:hypothetical protein
MTSVLVENGDGPGPGGAKGSGEGGLLATSPAIAAAVAQATGVVIKDLPITPERVWEAMHGPAVSSPAGGGDAEGVGGGGEKQEGTSSEPD